MVCNEWFQYNCLFLAIFAINEGWINCEILKCFFLYLKMIFEYQLLLFIVYLYIFSISLILDRIWFFLFWILYIFDKWPSNYAHIFPIFHLNLLFSIIFINSTLIIFLIKKNVFFGFFNKRINIWKSMYPAAEYIEMENLKNSNYLLICY